MLTERKYRVDKYLEMARLTKSIEKRENFIDMACYYLESKEFDVTKDEPTNFFENLEKEDVVGKPRQQIYEQYTQFCKDNGEILNSKGKFYKELEERFKLRERYLRLENETGEKIRARVYVEN